MRENSSADSGVSLRQPHAPSMRQEQGIPADTLSMTSPAANAPGGLSALMRRRPLVSFFVLAYAFTWLGWLPFVLSQSGLGLLPIHSDFLPLLGEFGPTAAGFIMVALTAGKPGARDLLRRTLQWRVNWLWYVFIFAGVPAVSLLSFLVLPGVAATLPALSVPFVVQFALLFAQSVIIASLTQALGEEPGWRGFALPRLQRRYGPVLGTLILGPLWAGWHLPLFLTTAFPERTPLAFFVFVLSTTSLSFVLTWVVNRSQGSVLMPVLVHGSINAIGQTIGMVGLFSMSVLQRDTEPAKLIGFGIVALALLVLTRGRLGSPSASE